MTKNFRTKLFFNTVGQADAELILESITDGTQVFMGRDYQMVAHKNDKGRLYFIEILRVESGLGFKVWGKQVAEFSARLASQFNLTNTNMYDMGQI